MSKQIYYQINSTSLGDTLSATPVIRKLSNLYGQKIIVINDLIDLFKNSPYIERTIHSSSFRREFLNQDDEYFMSFVLPGQQNQFGVERKFSTYDIRQIHAVDLGFMLMPEEMGCDFFADDDKNEFDLPENYIVLHTVKNWPNRTWSRENWQSIIDYLAKRNIFTVLVGKDSIEHDHHNRIVKDFYSFDNLNGINLINKDSLHSFWHILNNAKLFVTFDTGPLHLAGTTDVEILQLGGAKDPRLSAPYRNGSQNYKYSYLKGPCDLYCTNNLKYSIKEWNSINAVPPLPGCLDNKETFECQPTVAQVIKFLESTL